MKRATANEILTEYGLNATDAARLVAEACEGLGEERTRGVSRANLMVLLRRVVTEGVEAVKKAEETVSYAEAVRQSLEARSGLRPTSRRNLRHSATARAAITRGRPSCTPSLPMAYGRSGATGIPWTLSKPRASRKKTIEPLSLKQVERLEQTAERPEHRDMQLSLKLLLYCGIRPTEVTRIDPQRDIVGNELIIRPTTSKTGGGRVVPLRKVAVFIRRHKKELVIPPRWEQRWRALRRAARFRAWRPDICRHTFATYHARHFRNLSTLQPEMGHTTPHLLHSRYLTPIPAATAKKYWTK